MTVILILALGCGGQQLGGMSAADEAADIAAIEALMETELSTLVTGDVAASLALQSDNLVIMPPNDRAYTRAEAEEFFTGFLEAFTISAAEYVSHDISIHGDVAVDYYVGELTMTPAGSNEAVTEMVKGLHILERQADGSWLIAYDIWNSNSPAPEM